MPGWVIKQQIHVAGEMFYQAYEILELSLLAGCLQQ